MQLTQEQFERLPVVLKDVVRAHRELEDVASAPVVTIDRFKTQRALCREYVSAAARTFGPRKGKEETL